VEFLKTGNQTDFDRVCSNHKLDVHNVRDTCQLERDLLKTLESKYSPLPEKIEISGFLRVECSEEDCNEFFTASKPINYYMHCEYHEKLKSQNKSYKNSFPCLECSKAKFENYKTNIGLYYIGFILVLENNKNYKNGTKYNI